MGKLEVTANSSRNRTRHTEVAASTASLASSILAFSPLGYWKLNEGSGTTATDSSGNSRNGTYTGSGYTLQGAVGGDGASYVDLGNAASSHIAIADNNVWSLDNAPALTIFALMKPDSVAGTTLLHLISKGRSAEYEWFVGINESVGGRFVAGSWNSGGSAVMKARLSGDPITTAWQGVAVAFPTPSSNANIPEYRNNGSDNSANMTPGNSGYTNNTSPVWIGWRADSPANQYFGGGVAHVAIFAGAMSGANVGTLMTAAHNEGWF